MTVEEQVRIATQTLRNIQREGDALSRAKARQALIHMDNQYPHRAENRDAS